MNNTNEQLAVLRTVDKYDKLGRQGVVDLLQKPLEEFGADLMPWQAELIGDFIESGKGSASNEETLDRMAATFRRIVSVSDRFKFIGALEGQVVDLTTGETAWDRLLGMPQNEDETWKDGGRPKNIAFAVDDLIERIRLKEKEETK